MKAVVAVDCAGRVCRSWNIGPHDRWMLTTPHDRVFPGLVPVCDVCSRSPVYVAIHFALETSQPSVHKPRGSLPKCRVGIHATATGQRAGIPGARDTAVLDMCPVSASQWRCNDGFTRLSREGLSGLSHLSHTVRATLRLRPLHPLPSPMPMWKSHQPRLSKLS